MAILKVGVGGAGQRRAFKLVTSANVAVTGATVTVNLLKANNGSGTYAAAAGTITEVGSGWYYISLTSIDTQVSGDLGVDISATGGSGTAVPMNFVDQVQPQVFADLNLNAFGQVSVVSSLKINQALNGFQFLMTNATTNAPMTGLVAGGGITATRSLGGAGWGPCVNPVFEVGNGVYGINLAASDLNNVSVALRFVASGANDNVITIITQP